MDMLLHQIRSSDGTGTLSYIIADRASKKGVVLDPNLEDTALVTDFLKEHSIDLVYIIDTHTHVDHISGAGELRARFGAQVLMHVRTKEKWKVVDEGEKFGIGDILRANAGIDVDRYVEDGESVKVGDVQMKFLYTPGHTDNHIAVLVDKNLFTGDVLLIGQAGRSDLPGGDPSAQFDSFHEKILPLPDETRIWPGHDYQGASSSLLKDEKRTNPFLRIKDRQEYRDFVRNFFPPLVDVISNGRMTLQCGVQRINTTGTEPFQSVNPEGLEQLMKTEPDLFLLDVRERFELPAFGSIPGVVNIPTSEFLQRLNELPERKDRPVVVVCQTGSRSGEAARYLSQQGFSRVFNLRGGTAAWIRSGKKYERPSISI